MLFFGKPVCHVVCGAMLILTTSCGESQSSGDAGIMSDSTVASADATGLDASSDAGFSCDGIRNSPNAELCVESATGCEGVFTAGQGCIAFCAAAGLSCVARFGGDPGCVQETNSIPCDEVNGNMADYCVCGGGGGGGGGECNEVVGNPPTAKILGYQQGVYTAERSSWVVGCPSMGWDYAYTAQYSDHISCDPAYVPGSGAGIATFTFSNVTAGEYDVFVQGRHTTSRNPNGAKVIVNTGSAIHEKRINQRDSSLSYPLDLHGTYCLSGTVTVTIDSSEPGLSDSIQNIYLTPAG